MSFIVSNVLGRITGILIDIFLLVSASAAFLLEYFTTQACILFPFAVCSAFSVHMKNARVSGITVAVLAITIQSAVLILFAQPDLGMVILLGVELLVLVWALLRYPLSNLVQAFPWSGAAFNVVLLLMVFFAGSVQLQPLIPLVFGMRLVVFVVLLPVVRRVIRPIPTPTHELVEIGQWQMLARFSPVMIRQFVFVNARFFVPENLLSIVAIGARLLQNAFVFLLYPLLLSDVKMAWWLPLGAAFSFAMVTAAAVYVATNDLAQGAIIFGLTLSIVSMELGYAVRTKMRRKVNRPKAQSL